MDLSETDFAYTFLPADGTLADVRKRFRVPSGTEIQAFDGMTVNIEPKAGDALVIPKPADIPFYGKPTWTAFPAIPGESLPALIKRVDSAGPETRVVNPAADMTPGYVWHDWQNVDLRQSLLVPAGTAVGDGPKKDLDPKTLKFAGGENVALPIKPIKHFDAAVAPGKTGDSTGPVATVDVSHSEFEELHHLLDGIEGAIDLLDRLREQTLGTQAQCETWLVALADLQEQAIKSDATWKLGHPGGDSAKRDAFIVALAALIDKVGPLILDPRSCVPKVAPDLLASAKEKTTTDLIPLIENARTKELLAKLIPSHGDVPRLERQGEGTIITIDRVCVLAARAAHWVGEAAPRDTASSLLDAAMTAMASGTAPSASATSIIDFAVAIPYFAPPPVRDKPPSDDFRDLLDTDMPEGCATVVAAVFWSLKISEAAAQQDGTVASAATERVGAGLDKVASQSGWTSFKKDFASLAQSGFEGWKVFKEKYKPVEEAKGAAETGKAIAQAADPAIQAAKGVDEESDALASARLGIIASNMYGADRMKKAYAVVEEMQSPSQRFPARWRMPGKKIPAIWGLGKLAFQVAKGVRGTGSDFDGSVRGALKTEKAAIETVKDAAESLQKLKIIETEELTLMLGRVTLVLGVAIELCEIREAVDEKDVVGALSHGALAAACICFLLGGVCCTVGTGLLAAGTVPLILRSGAWNSDTAIQMAKLFPDAGDAASDGEKTATNASVATFEARCSKALDIDQEIKQVKQAFGDAVAARRAISGSPSPW